MKMKQAIAKIANSSGLHTLDGKLLYLQQFKGFTLYYWSSEGFIRPGWRARVEMPLAVKGSYKIEADGPFTTAEEAVDDLIKSVETSLAAGQ